MSRTMAGARCPPLEDHEAVLRRTAEWASARGGEILLADARVVFGPDHLESATLHAERAKAAGSMVARTVSLESLRYLSGKRQLADAIRLAGIRAGTETVALLGFGEVPLDEIIETLGWRRDDAVLDAEGKDLSAIGVTKRERGTIDPKRAEDLALERVALVDVER